MDWPADVDPAALRQPDRVSCGPTTVVAARMLLDPAWRPADVPAEVLAAHRALTGLTGPTGRTQLPWPTALGTPPWAIAGVLSDLTGARVRSSLARWRAPAAYDDLLQRVAQRPVAVYIGSTWLPRHVVLAFDAAPDGSSVRVLDPARGRLVDVAADRWRTQQVDVAGWSALWFVV
ncbi:MAG TPA: hypothetical protein VNS55_00380 [Nocardioides sp.]|nr:hypothetical protein [Nocardioides sp.]